jgi:hypothetical protein
MRWADSRTLRESCYPHFHFPMVHMFMQHRSCGLTQFYCLWITNGRRNPTAECKICANCTECVCISADISYVEKHLKGKLQPLLERTVGALCDAVQGTAVVFLFASSSQPCRVGKQGYPSPRGKSGQSRNTKLYPKVSGLSR